MLNFRTPIPLAAALLLAVGTAACDGDAPTRPGPLLEPDRIRGHRLSAEVAQGVAAFRAGTARYHSVSAAVADGFEQIVPCLENPEGSGAVGIPYARLDRFDETIDLSEPEILFYEPQKNGRLRLVGGEPVIPIDLWTGSRPPSLFGQEFHRNDTHGLYGLHMWVWRHNPDGIFEFWHPDVSCEFAEP